MFRITLLLFVVCLLAAPAFPSVVTTYSSQATFEGALTNLKMVNFSVLVNDFTDYSAQDLIDAGTSVVFHNQLGDPSFALFTARNPFYEINSAPVLVIPNAAGTALLITFPTAVSGMAFNAMTLFGDTTFVITLPGGTQQTFTAPQGNGVAPAYIAFTSDTPFTTLQISTTNPNARGVFNAMEFGDAGAPPPAETAEVSTFLMIGTGLALMRFTQRRLIPHF